MVSLGFKTVTQTPLGYQKRERHERNLKFAPYMETIIQETAPSFLLITALTQIGKRTLFEFMAG